MQSVTQMLRELSIRKRFLAAAMALSLVVAAGFAVAIHHSLEAIEDELVGTEFSEVFDEITQDYTRTGHLPRTVRHGYEILAGDDPGGSPRSSALSALAPGVYYETDVAGHEYNIGKTIVNGSPLYVLQDPASDTLEVIERRVLGIALWVGSLAVLAAMALALWLSKLVVDPVKNLASAVGALVPGEPRTTLPHEQGGPELRIIALALDAAFDRFEAFAERERSFTRDASHELRTPLAVMSSGVQLLAGDPQIGAGHGELIGRLRSSTRQMQILTDALLMLAREDSAIPSKGAETFSPAELVQDAITLQTDAAGRRRTEISLRIEGDRKLCAPPGMLLCVVNNLLRNAIEHSATTTIDVTVDSDRLVIADHGKGIDPDIVPQLFEKNIRGADSRGGGIGLDLVRRICDRQGWDLSFSTDNTRGTRFELRYG